MTNILRIDSSSRLTGSRSRELGDYVETQWAAMKPQTLVMRRDLALQPIEQIRQETITGFYTPADALTADLRAATALSDRLIAEVQGADALLITAPIYNFGVPAALKAWIDQIVRIGHTFSYDGTRFGGLARPRMAIICTAYGASGYQAGQPYRGANFLEPYLDFLLKFLGIPAVHVVTVQATTADLATVETGMAEARLAIDRLLHDIAK